MSTTPLHGRRIAVTRAREQASELSAKLAALGAEVIELPLIKIEKHIEKDVLADVMLELGSYDWIVFTSANGVDYFMQRLQAGPRDVRELKGVRLCAIGPGTADRLARHGIRVDLMPAEYRTEAVVEALRSAGDLAGKTILLPRANIARELLAEGLRKLGAEVTEVTAYRTVPVEGERVGEPDVYRMLLEKQLDVVTFTSASTVRHFVRIYGAEPAADLLRTTLVASIGPVTAEAAEQLNIHTSIMPAEYTIPGLVDAIVAHFEKASTTPASEA